LIVLGVAILALSATGIGLGLAIRNLGRNEEAPEAVHKMRDLAMEFIGKNHPEIEPFMVGIEWVGGRETPEGLVGAETFRFRSGGWTCTISYPVVLKLRYGIVVTFSTALIPGYVGAPHEMTWRGTYEDGLIHETSYVFT